MENGRRGASAGRSWGFLLKSGADHYQAGVNSGETEAMGFGQCKCIGCVHYTSS